MWFFSISLLNVNNKLPQVKARKLGSINVPYDAHRLTYFPLQYVCLSVLDKTHGFKSHLAVF